MSFITVQLLFLQQAALLLRRGGLSGYQTQLLHHKLFYHHRAWGKVVRLNLRPLILQKPR